MDGRECPWGRVARWSPPNRLVLLWQIEADWTHDPSLGAEVEIDFVRAEALRAAFDGLGGWSDALARFAEFAR